MSIANSKQPELDFELAASALVERIGDPDPVVRAQVLHALGKIGPRAADNPPPAVVAALEDTDPSVRKQVVNTLGSYVRGLHRLVPALFHFVEGDGPAVRANYLEVLAHLRPHADPPQPASFELEDVPTLIVALGSRDQAVRCVAASDLGEFGPAAISAVPALIEILRVSLHSPVEAGTPAWPAWVPPDVAEVAARVGPGRAGSAINGSDLSIEGSARSSCAAPREAAALALGKFGRDGRRGPT